MTLNRRQLFRLVGAGAALSSLGTTAAVAAQPKFVKPTAEKPMLLCFNENPLGMSEKAKEAVAKAAMYGSRYPFAQVIAFKKDLAKFMNVRPDEVLLTHGSAEAIRATIEAEATKNTVLVQPELTYGDGADVAKRNNIPVKNVKMGPNWSIDLAALRKVATAEAKKHRVLVYLVNPNNPTSSVIPRNQMRDILDYCKKKSITVLVDETYVEFAPDVQAVTAIPLTEYYNNIIILRGISKFFAAPGLRLGYAICGNKDLLKEINQKKNPWTINSLAAIAGEIMFSDEEYIRKTRQLIASERERICQAIRSMGAYQVYESNCNFVLVKIKKEGLTADQIFDTAIRQGLMIRDCSTFPFLNDKYFRLCFMMPEDNDRLLAVLKKLAD